MKVLLALFSFSLIAAECPVLKGEYHCMISSTQYSLLVVDQKVVSNNLVEYSFNYTAIPGDPDVFLASSTGEHDDMGWVTRCKDQRLQSGNYYGQYSEIYLNRGMALVQTHNGVIKLTCPKKGHGALRASRVPSQN